MKTWTSVDALLFETYTGNDSLLGGLCCGDESLVSVVTCDLLEEKVRVLGPMNGTEKLEDI